MSKKLELIPLKSKGKPFDAKNKIKTHKRERQTLTNATSETKVYD